MRIYLVFWLFVVTLAASACVTSPTTTPRARETVLSNGLKVIVKPDHRAPVVTSQIWYKVGSSYEPEGKTGVSHVLEHMMFKGTKTLAPNEFSRIIAEQGGRENAFTGKDFTSYFQTLEKSRLELAFRLEADRMRNLDIKDDEFKKEIQVIKEERRLQVDDRPEALIYEKFMATAFAGSGYGHPIIGWPQDLDRLRVQDVRDWYHKYYRPSNAVLVVVGDIDAQRGFDLARRHFGPIRGEPAATAVRRGARLRGGGRISEVSRVAKVPYLVMGYHTPALPGAGADGWEPYALEILAHVLDGGKSARLPRELVLRRQIASSVGAGYDPISRGGGLFVIDGNPSSGHSLEDLEAGVRAQIKLLQQQLITPVELSRIKAQILAARIFEQDSVFYQGMKIGMLESRGLSWRVGRDFHDRLDVVTAQQVRAVAGKYLIDRNLTMAVMHTALESAGSRRKLAHRSIIAAYRGTGRSAPGYRQ